MGRGRQARLQRVRVADYYPIYLNMRRRPAVVIGGGKVAERKVAALIECGARVTVIGPDATPAIREAASRGEARWLNRGYEPGDLAGAALAIAATDDASVNRAVAEEAARERVLLNVIDQPELCTFIAPAVARRGPVTLAISTGGASPALARKLRQSLEKGCGDGCALAYADLAGIAADARQELRRRKARVPAARWQQCMDGALLEMVRRGEVEEARKLLVSRLLGEQGTGKVESR